MAMGNLKCLVLLTVMSAAACSEHIEQTGPVSSKKPAGSSGTEHPCGGGSASRPIDPECVRTQLAARSGCTPVCSGAGLDPYYPPKVNMYTSYFNLTLVKIGSTYRGLSDSVVTDFAVDHNNNVTIISLLHPYINLTGPMDVFFQRINKASLKVATEFHDQYTNLLTWTIIPGTTSLDLSKRETHYYETTPANVTFGDENLQSYIDSDPLVAATVEALKANIYIVVHDSLYSMSKVFAYAVIDLTLCSLTKIEPLFQDNPL